jgi:two-component system nitrogen regulation response regulator GlnG
VRRVAALHAEQTLTQAIIDQEIATATPPRREVDGEARSLSELVERHLAEYFASFGKELPPPNLYDRVIREVEIPLITAALAATRGNQIRAAELLGLNRNTLRTRIRDLDIRVLRTPVGAERP